MRRELPSAVLLLATIVLSGCGSAAGGLPPPQPAKVTVSKPLVRPVRDANEYTGRVEAVETVDVRARVSGYLQEIYFNDGDDVEEGAKLFLIDPSTYEAELAQAESKINVWEAKYNYQKAVRVRNESLHAKGAVAKEELEQSIAAEKESLASQKAAEADRDRAKLNVDFCHINSPIKGRIDRRFVTKGNLIDAGTLATSPLTTIVSIQPVYVYFNPDELAFLRYKEKRLAEEKQFGENKIRDLGIEAHVILSDGAHYPATGKVDFAANRVDPSTGTIQVRIVFQNERKALTPGMFVRVLVSSDKPYEAILVPERAIGTDQSDKFVYVVDEKNIAQRRNVVLGTKHGRLRAIKEGVGPNDRVIISGALLVRPGDPVEVIGEEKIKDDLPPVEVTQLKPAADDAQTLPARPAVER